METEWNIIGDNFWFFSAAFWFVSIRLYWPKHLPDGPERPSDDAICAARARIMAWVCIPQLIVGLLQLASGESILDQLERTPDLSNPYAVAADAFMAVLWILFVWWLWARASTPYLLFLAGNVFLLRRPRILRWVYTVVVAIAATSLVVDYARTLTE
jgi:hypothetical protein